MLVTGNGYASPKGCAKSGETYVRIWGKVVNEGGMVVSLQC